MSSNGTPESAYFQNTKDKLWTFAGITTGIKKVQAVSSVPDTMTIPPVTKTLDECLGRNIQIPQVDGDGGNIASSSAGKRAPDDPRGQVPKRKATTRTVKSESSKAAKKKPPPAPEGAATEVSYKTQWAKLEKEMAIAHAFPVWQFHTLISDYHKSLIEMLKTHGKFEMPGVVTVTKYTEKDNVY